MNSRAFALLTLAILVSSLPAPLAGARTGAASRRLAEYAQVCDHRPNEAYTITGECVTKQGLDVGGEFRRFDEPCKWTLDLVGMAKEAISCILDRKDEFVCKALKLTGPKGAALCGIVCAAIDGVKDNLTTKADCADDGKKNGSAGCFPGSALVRVHNGTLAPLRSLAPGEAILAVRPDGRTEYSKMFMLTAPMPHRRATFVRIATEAGLSITLTPNHYLFALSAAEAEMSAAAPDSLNAWRYVLPTEISVGDIVPVVSSGAAGASFTSSRVTKVEMVEDVGIFMPHTAAGAVVVDGIVATQLTTSSPKWMARHSIAHPLMLALHKALSLLPPGLARTAADEMSLAVHGVKPTGLWTKPEL